MSAPEIPNLNTLRRGGFRGRGRGQSLQSATTPGRTQVQKDDIIRNTDTDAATSRLSAVEAGYLDDPFAKLLSGSQNATRRLPLMNRGTYVRTTGIDRIVDVFLSSTSRRRQIISLGAGSDTRYFRLKRQQPELDLLYHELDFESNTRDKITRLRTPQFVDIAKEQCRLDLLSSEYEILNQASRLRSASYFIHPQDLRELSAGRPALADVDPDLPTLLISECCLIYLPPDKADSVLEYFINLIASRTPLAMVIYEPIRPSDPFGRTMVSNLIARGIQLQTLEKYAGLQEQINRLRHQGFSGQHDTGGAEAADVDFIWRHWIDDAEKERVDGLEWMDEVEEFILLAQHYCISWGWRGFDSALPWRTLPRPESNGL